MMSNNETLARLNRIQTAQSPPDGVICILTDRIAMAQKLVIG
ncbi:MAG TPA: hypothetical protein VIC53_03825 [Wenzhouxiangella sp.]